MVGALAALGAGYQFPVAAAADEIYVSNYTANTITVYVRTANGDVWPIRTIQTGLDHPHTLGMDLLHQELFVPNNLMDVQQPAVNVYDLDASYPGNDSPKRTITGALTGLNRPSGLAVDSVNQELYVANDVVGGSSITVYPLGANGNVAPVRTLQGALTGIEGPIGMAVDPVHDELIVASYRVAGDGTISVFPRTADGNVLPLRTIQGTLTGFNRPQGLALDLVHDEIVVANSYFSTSSPGNVLVFARSASGNVAPLRQISGPDTALCNPIGLVLDLVNGEIVTANSNFGTGACAQSVTTYTRTATDDATPVREIGPGPVSALSNPTSLALRTRIDCSDPSVADGTPCDDGSACTQVDTCQGGVCSGGNPVVCTTSDQCHVAGTCNPATGTCSNPPAAADGAACNDGDACTQSDSCLAGVCTGSNPVVCTPGDPCHEAGTCDPGTGLCSNPNKADGTACNDDNACTYGDVCTSGVCGGTSITCTDDPCNTVTCNGTSTCTLTPKTDGTACDDGNACTQTDTCESGTCTGGNPVVCTASDQCHVAGTCNPATGTCSNPAAGNGTACNDGNVCTLGDSCNSGSCQPGIGALNCNDSNPCTDDSCDPVTGCAYAANTAACDDGNDCTSDDICGGGICAGTTITAPPEVQNVVPSSDKSTYSWSAATFATQYDVVRGSTGALPGGPGDGDEVCFDNLAGPSLTDATVPAANTGFWYLSRGKNACGIGTFGTRSNGSARTTTTCP
jgi:Lactonase, 7-bladed beta-propeller